MTRSRTYQVKDVARLTGVSIRTLHHYDAIGLLVPSGRTAAAYRLYTDADLLRLQQILIGRELGLALEEIRKSLDDPRFDRTSALLDQRERLRERARQTEAMIRAIDVALAACHAEAERGQALDGTRTKGEMNMADLFEGFNSAQYEDEARRQWGTTDAYAESQTRTRRYTPDDWNTIKAEQTSVYAAAVAVLKAGKSSSSSDAMDIAEQHRMSIDRWFYPCSHDMQRGLAAMYESDDRFRQSIDMHGQGLTAFLAEAIRANAARQRK